MVLLLIHLLSKYFLMGAGKVSVEVFRCGPKFLDTSPTEKQVRCPRLEYARASGVWQGRGGADTRGRSGKPLQLLPGSLTRTLALALGEVGTV